MLPLCSLDLSTPSMEMKLQGECPRGIPKECPKDPPSRKCDAIIFPGLSLELRFAPAAPPAAATISPSPGISSAAPRLTRGRLASAPFWKQHENTGEEPAAGLCCRCSRQTQIPGQPGQRAPGSPGCQEQRDGRPREYTDRLMAAVDAAQLDFTSPLLKESAALPCSEIPLSP